MKMEIMPVLEKIVHSACYSAPKAKKPRKKVKRSKRTPSQREDSLTTFQVSSAKAPSRVTLMIKSPEKLIHRVASQRIRHKYLMIKRPPKKPRSARRSHNLVSGHQSITSAHKIRGLPLMSMETCLKYSWMMCLQRSEPTPSRRVPVL